MNRWECVAVKAVGYLLEYYDSGNRYIHARPVANAIDVDGKHAGHSLVLLHDEGLLEQWSSNTRYTLYTIPETFPDEVTESAYYDPDEHAETLRAVRGEGV